MMPPSPRPADLRLTIPATVPYHALAGELAGKFAEYSGADSAAAATLASTVEALTDRLGATAPNGSIALVMEARERELVVVAESGSRREQTSCPLPA
jgi:hypothetical protein